jgi:hypothetical protein
MFSLKQKQYIAGQIEKILLELKHPEMPKEKPVFTLKVEGKEDWSWAEIKPNWIFGIDNPPEKNPWNEGVAEGMEKT